MGPSFRTPPRIRPAPRELLDATTGIPASWPNKARSASIPLSAQRRIPPAPARMRTNTTVPQPARRRRGSSLHRSSAWEMRHCCARAVTGCLCAELSATHAQSRCLLKAPPCLPSVGIRQSPGCRKSKQTADSATRRAGSLLSSGVSVGADPCRGRASRVARRIPHLCFVYVCRFVGLSMGFRRSRVRRGRVPGVVCDDGQC
ncbi:hypothetical protein F5144DRAFT_88175 [Chaetomium tenue]|uniref:Uncharacterized protein n=1 Tax=Chaetomium tenue TaxID=1854479 RepID=A0ACB7PJG4_9PEZI|nr:hypothetical protein F5144DRAFT_88175 [Chaetomium globosum]